MENYTLSEWVSILTSEHVLVLSNRNITAGPFLHGEDYFMSTLVSRLKKRGIEVDVLVLLKPNGASLLLGKSTRHSNHSDTANKSIEKLVRKDTLIILHNVSPSYIVKTRMERRGKVIFPIYFGWNKERSAFWNIKSITGQVFWQFSVDEYLATSPYVAERLKQHGIVRKIKVVSPEYSCSFCRDADNMKKKSYLADQLPSVVDMVYIGTLESKRFPLKKILKALRSDSERQYRLKIYTTSEVDSGTYHCGNVKVRIVVEKLSDLEKCRVLRESCVFIAPTKGTTMEPPISVLEAEYHGNVVMRF